MNRLDKSYLKKKRIKEKPAKAGSQTQEEKEFQQWARDRGCLVCGAPAEFHHHPYLSKKGAASHKRGVPLCVEHHKPPMGIHGLHDLKFNRLYGVNIQREADTLFQRFLASKK